MAKDITLTIDNTEVTVPEGTTIIQAARQAGIAIPSLCYHPDLRATGNCGVCVVEIEGMPTPKRSCTTPAVEGMKVRTNSKELRRMRKNLVEIILSNHDIKCPTCVQNGKCELQDLAYHLGIEEVSLPTILTDAQVDRSSHSIVRDPKKCIACGRCLTVCNEVQTVYALTFDGRGFEGNITTAFDEGMANSSCINCGQCAVYCPTGALREKDTTEAVWDALLDENKYVVVQEAPAIRATLGEEFGMDPNEVTVGKMYAALRKLGFDRVFDTNFSADLTIMEEGTELINRVKGGGKLPVITSCSPGWIKFMETYYPDFGENVSSCKSPQQMFGALVKTYFAEKEGIDPKNIFSVSIMPCTAKKFEAKRPEMQSSGYPDVDAVLTTREFIRMIQEAGFDFKSLPEEKADDLMGAYTGAATIFGATGGVMEAAIRSAYFLLSGEELKELNIKSVRGLEGIKEAAVTIPAKGIGDLEVKVAVAHGLGNARKLLDMIRSGEKDYHFIEIMACPGGCVGGGGQPFGSSLADRARRAQNLYKEDSKLAERCSHHNPEITKIYKEYLGEPGSHKAHELLHTHYYKRSEITGEVVEEIGSAHH